MILPHFFGDATQVIKLANNLKRSFCSSFPILLLLGLSAEKTFHRLRFDPESKIPTKTMTLL